MTQARATPTPTSVPLNCATRHPARPARAPPSAGPSIWPVIRKFEKPAIVRPRRDSGPRVANSFMPVMLVCAETRPSSKVATSAWTRDCALASSAAAIAMRTPVALSAIAGGSRSAIRPAGRSITRRPTAKLAVMELT
jgi:hypothetical protein